MQNLFDEKKAEQLKDDPLALRVYTSRLLGQSADLVLHGGGNTSVKIGDTIYVKGSGWNLDTIEKAGFSPVDLEVLIDMASREELSDTEMVEEQRSALRDSSAPNPSIEAILHAIIPFDYVDHTHTDAVVTISNTPNGKKILQELYGENILIVDYVMPGFILAKHIYDLTRNINWNKLDGILLLNHGLFTFNNSAKLSYNKMIELVSIAEEYILENTISPKTYNFTKPSNNMLNSLQEKVSVLRGMPIVVKSLNSVESIAFSRLSNIESIISEGGLTPEHVIRIKPFPAVIEDDIEEGINSFIKAYESYFNSYSNLTHITLDLAPRYAIIKNIGVVTFGKDDKEAGIIADIVEHTLKAMLIAEQLGGWKSLAQHDLFAMEYWELEQKKLKKEKGN